MRRFIFIFVFVNLCIGQAIACSCIGLYSFCETAATGTGIMEVEVTKKYTKKDNQYSKFVDFKVVERLIDSDSIQHENLTLYEGGTSCDVFLFEQVKVGDRLFINYHQAFAGREKEASHPVIYFYNCLNNYLIIENGQVSGSITKGDRDKPEKISARKFRRNASNICDINSIKEELILFKNSVSHGTLEISNKSKNDLEFDIFNSSGALVHTGQVLSSEEKELYTRDFPPAIYFIRFRYGKEYFTRKVALFKG